MKGNVVLFEDHLVDRMWPVTLTRPAFAVTCASYTLYEVVSSVTDHIRYIVREHLRDPAVRAYPQCPSADGSVLFVNASVAPDIRYAEWMRKALAESSPFIAVAGERVAASLLPSGREIPDDLSPENVGSFLRDQDLPVLGEEVLQTLDYPFDIVRLLKQLFAANIQNRVSKENYVEVRDGLFVGGNVKLADTAVFHTEDGPVVLGENVCVLDFTYFVGPVYVGPNSRIIERSSVKECVSIGHTCKIGGEVEASVVEPHTNKQHHGFLGHAYVGSWVNLGAGTSNSDLKNTYGKVRARVRGRPVETGMRFLGCVIGDNSKSAINTSIFTGKTIGVASMLYGYVGQDVPSFCNYAKSFGQITEIPLKVASRTQKRMFARRGVEQTDVDVELLRKVFELTREERQIAAEAPVF